MNRPSLPPQRLSIRRKVMFGFGFVLLMVIVIAVLTWGSTSAFLENAELLARSHDRLSATANAFRHHLEMENARRAFQLTGEDRYAARFDEARKQTEESLSKLQRLGSELSTETEETLRVVELITRSIRVQTEEVAARRKAPPRANNGVPSAPGDSDALSEQIAATLAGIEDRERELLRERAELTDLIGGANAFVLLIGTSLTLVALLSAGSMILRDIAARRRAEEALADQHNLLSSIIDTIPDNIFVKDVKGRYIMSNRAHNRYLNLGESQGVEGRTVFDYFPPELAKQYDRDDHRVLETGRSLRNQEEPGIPDGASERWFSTTKVPLKEPGGRILGLVCVSSEVTDRKKAEERLKRFASQLERSNMELQNFASVASHDLQEPLRKIQAFGDRLKAKCGDQLGELGLDYLSRMQNAAERMRILIQDLLKLSRVTSRAQPFASCDLSMIVQEVLSDLEVAIEQYHAQVEVSSLPTIEADPLQMRQLLQNLISNALKFQKPDVTPKVIISGETFSALDHEVPGALPGEPICRITVQDNGIGFDEKFAEQIFAVFQRLHSRSEYEGTGIGLAVCRKITDRHGGSILAKSTEGQGATFIVTLPVHQPPIQAHD